MTGGGGGNGGGDATDGSSAEDFNTEYAKSGKSKCKGCEDFIAKVMSSFLIHKKIQAETYGFALSLSHTSTCFCKWSYVRITQDT